MAARLILGDCRDVMATMPADSVDSIVTDPPYGLSFMGKDWDHGVPGIPFWEVALRVAKPGAYLVAAGAPRTHHRLMCALEDAGWEIRDVIMHVFGSGFPKSMNVTKALRAMPSCRCGIAKVTGEIGAIDSALPLGNVGASVGAVTGTMPLAGRTTDKAKGLGSQSCGGSLGRQGQMQGGIEVVHRQLDPIVFGALDVTSVAERDEVTHNVGIIQAQPEPLRDNVVGHKVVGCTTVGTSAVAGDDPFRDNAPLSAAVSPGSVAPSGIAGAAEASAVVSGHTLTGAVDPLRNLAGDGLTTEPTVKGVHDQDDTTKCRVCPVCGGLIQENIPDGLGTALKPAYEPWIICRKPLIGTVVQNVLAYGAGALNIDGCRIVTGETIENHSRSAQAAKSKGKYGDSAAQETHQTPGQALGRWPANLILTYAEDEYMLRHDVTTEQQRELYAWLAENA